MRAIVATVFPRFSRFGRYPGRVTFPRARRLGALLALSMAASSCLSASDLDERISASADLDQTTRIEARDGTVLADLHAEINREIVPLSAIPKVLQDAVVAVEDRRFWTHGGIDGPALARALSRNLAEGKVVEGGSTITQQLAKSMLEDPERTLERKVREAVLARSLEQRFSKEEILERYLNVVYFGRGAYGVQAASRMFFGRDVGEISLPQAALLAAMIRAPSQTDPTRHRERARERRAQALRAMREMGAISAATERATAAAGLGAVPPRARTWRAPYFVSHVIDQVGDGAHGLDVLGPTRADRERRLFRGGLRITTTLEPDMQRQAEEAVASILREPQAAFVALDPTDGGVRALVGGRDPEDPSVGAFDLATQARRQPGSAFKPFTLAAALENGVDLGDTFRAPSRMTLQVPGGTWSVGNYDGSAFGAMSLRAATAQSVNTVYAQVAMRVGPERVAELSRRAGIESPMRAYPSIALGAQEVTPLELARAYATFASGGIRRDAVAISEITDARGEVLYRAPAETERVLSGRVAAGVTEALRGVVVRGTAAGLDPGFPVAAKTGTTDDHRDAWFAGYSPRLVAAAWVGFAEEARPMIPPATRLRVTGANWPGQIWNRFMRATHRGLPALDFASAPVEVVVVPALIGTPGDDARTSLRELGLVARTVGRYCPEVRPGAVCAQDPAAGTSVREGDEVTLAIADDSALATVPSVLGARTADARRTLAGFGVEIVERENSEAYEGCRDPSVRARGRVWAQWPCSGATYGVGSVVTLFVSP
jgi:membrane peptidoglycan carboxypeptidase